MQLVNYKMFDSNEEFAKWQKDATFKGITSVSPIIKNISGEGNEENDVNLTPEIQVFVVYVTEEEEQNHEEIRRRYIRQEVYACIRAKESLYG